MGESAVIWTPRSRGPPGQEPVTAGCAAGAGGSQPCGPGGGAGARRRGAHVLRKAPATGGSLVTESCMEMRKVIHFPPSELAWPLGNSFLSVFLRTS